MRALLALAACSLVFCACDSTSAVVAPGKVVVSASSVNSDLHLVVNASNTALNLNSVTLHLLSGENVGGPSVTYPQAGLTSLFGSTVIVRGGSRSFVFRPPFGCTAMRPCTLRADVTVIDGSGMPQVTSTTTTMP